MVVTSTELVWASGVSGNGLWAGGSTVTVVGKGGSVRDEGPLSTVRSTVSCVMTPGFGLTPEGGSHDEMHVFTPSPIKFPLLYMFGAMTRTMPVEIMSQRR